MSDTPFEQWIEREGYLAGFEDGVRAGRLSATLQWPALGRSGYAARAYRLGIERGRMEAARERLAVVVVIHQPPPLVGEVEDRPRVRVISAGELGEAAS